MWPDTRLIDLFGIEIPIIQAPMANACGVEMAVAVAEAGGLGSFPCAALTDPATGRITIYYGCADTVTSLAFGYVDEVIDFVKKNSL